MKNKFVRTGFMLLMTTALLSACGGLPKFSFTIGATPGAPTIAAPAQAQPTHTPAPITEKAQAQTVNSNVPTSLSAYESTLEGIYAQVNPAVERAIFAQAILFAMHRNREFM